MVREGTCRTARSGVDRRRTGPYPHSITMNPTLDIVPAGLALLDADGAVLSATPAFSRVLGFDSSPVGHELGDLLCTVDDSDGVESALDKLRRGEAVELEAWCWRGAEGPAAVCLVAAPLEMKRIPPQAAASGRDADLLTTVLHQLEDPPGFLRRVEQLYADPEASACE